MNALHQPFSPAIVLAGVLILIVAGCARQDSGYRTGPHPDEAAFDLGGDQAPSANTLYALSRILATQGRDAEAEHVLLQIIQQHPGYLAAYSDLAEIHLRRNRTDAAAEVLLDGLGVAPGDPVLLNNLGMVWFLREDYERALQLFDAAVRHAPAHQTYAANQAAALGMLGQEEEAAAIYRQVLGYRRDVEHNLEILREARTRSPASAAPGTAPLPAPRAAGGAN